MFLYINTTDFSKITFAISDGEKVQQKSFVIDPHKSHLTLQKLEEFFNKSKIVKFLPAGRQAKSSIKKIIVNKGPGSYTGTRIGVTIGQALSLAWNVPVKFMTADALIKSGFRR